MSTVVGGAGLRIVPVLLALSLSVGSACSRTASGALAAASAADSVRGVLTLVGNEPVTVLFMASPTGGGAGVALAGAQTEMLRRVVGLDIVAMGRRTGRLVTGAAAQGVAEFVVSEFQVRSADGVPAHDGVVLSTNGVFRLRLADGAEQPTPQLPQALRRLAGARVWLAGPLNAAPQSYGVIRDP